MWLRQPVAVSLVAGFAWLVMVAPGSACEIDVQRIYDVGGDPVLVPSFSPDGSLAKPSWEICDPSCRPAADDQFLEPGLTAAGTTFRALADYGGHRYVSETPPWQGRVATAGPPAVLGDTRVGRMVRPEPATWTGGWGDEYSALGVVACRTVAAQRCRTLMDVRYAAREMVRVPSWAAGRFLFATDSRFAADTAYAGIGYRSPGSVPPVTPSQTVAFSQPLGPVTGPRPLRIRHRSRLVQRNRRVVVGRVRYSQPCRVQIEVGDRDVGFVGRDQAATRWRAHHQTLSATRRQGPRDRERRRRAASLRLPASAVNAVRRFCFEAEPAAPRFT